MAAPFRSRVLIGFSTSTERFLWCLELGSSGLPGAMPPWRLFTWIFRVPTPSFDGMLPFFIINWIVLSRYVWCLCHCWFYFCAPFFFREKCCVFGEAWLLEYRVYLKPIQACSTLGQVQYDWCHHFLHTVLPVARPCLIFTGFSITEWPCFNSFTKTHFLCFCFLHALWKIWAFFLTSTASLKKSS